MKEQSISIEEIVSLLKRHLLSIIVSLVVCSILALELANYFPKSFKSKSTLAIESAYFRNPLVSDLISEVTDSNELIAERSALLRLALNPEFLDQLALLEPEPQRFNPIQRKANASQIKSERRNQILKAIEFYSLTPTSYQIAVSASEAGRALAMNQAVLKQMITTLVSVRSERLEQTYLALQKHLRDLGAELRNVSHAGASQDGESLRSELRQVQSELDNLLAHYTDKHPEVVKLQMKAASLDNLVKSAPEVGQNSGLGVLTPAAKRPIQDVYNELLRKLSFIGVIIDIENTPDSSSYLRVIEPAELPLAPFFPNKRIFLAAGLIIGAIISLAMMLLSEMRRVSQYAPALIARAAELPFLGSLPELDRKRERTLLGSKAPPIGLPTQLGLRR